MEVIVLGIKRDDLAKIFAGLSFNTGAEIGVERGHYSKVLCEANKNLHLYCIDPWKLYPEYITVASVYRSGRRSFERNYKAAKKRLEPFNCSIIRNFSIDAARDFGAGSLDFVYIDGNHEFEFVLEDIENWSRFITSRGIVAGHDYNMKSVRKAVDLYVEKNHIDHLFLTDEGTNSSWFFFKK